MADLSGLSDDELMGLYNQKKSAAAPSGLSQMSDDDLLSLYNKKTGKAPKDEIVQEMPDEVSWMDRALVKNLGNGDGGSIDYLQKQYPDFEVKRGENEILMRKKGEQPWKTLDPSKSWSERLAHPLDALKEGVMDTTDLATDLGTGALTTAASGAAGLAAAPTAVGALPAAAGAGAATGAGLEYLRQKLGQALGVNKDVSGKDVGVAGALGAAAPVLFGSGAGANAIADSAKGLSAIEKTAIENSHKGLLTRAANNVMSFASGIPKQTIDTLGSKMDDIVNLEKSATPKSDIARGIQNEVEDLAKAKTAVGAAREAAVKDAGGTIALDQVKAPFLSKIKELEDMQLRAIEAGDVGAEAQAKEALDAVKSEFESTFGKFGNDTSLEAADMLKNNLKSKGKITKVNSKGVGVNPSEASDANTQLVQRTYKQSGGNLSNEIKGASDDIASKDAEYRWLSNVQRELAKGTKTEDQALGFVNKAIEGGNEALIEKLAKADKGYGTDFIGNINLADAFNTFRKSRPVEIGWRALRNRAPAEVAGGAAGAYLGAKNGGGWGGGILGGALGTGAGFVGASPSAIRLYVRGMKQAAKARGAVVPTWNLLNTNAQQE
jgi:hypothetical protein